MCSNVGMLIVAAFQENEVILMHLLGAFLTFGLGVLYALVQTVITFKLHRAAGSEKGRSGGDRPLTPVPEVLARAGLKPNQGWLAKVRLGLMLASAAVAVMVPAFGMLSWYAAGNMSSTNTTNCTDKYLPAPDKPGEMRFHGHPLRWLPCYSGWAYHTASAACEWCLAFLFLAFFLTFYSEFRQVEFSHNLHAVSGNAKKRSGRDGNVYDDCNADGDDDSLLLSTPVN